MIKPCVKDEVEKFVKLMSGITTTAEVCIPLLMKELQVRDSKMEELHKKAIKIEEDDDEHYVCAIETRIECLPVRSEAEKLYQAVNMLPSTLFCTMYNCFENHISSLYCTALLAYPNILESSEYKITFKDVVKAENIEDVVNKVLEAEVFSFTNASLHDQLKRLESRFKTDLITKHELWKQLIKNSLRRNLITHNAGIINDGYLANCSRYGCEIYEHEKVGYKIDNCPRCFGLAYATIFLSGIRIGHNFWRHVFPGELQDSDDSLLTTGYALLKDEMYDLSKRFHDFACNLPKYSEDRTRRMMVVNHALSYYLSDDMEYAISIMQEEDWTAASEEFKLANAILNDNTAAASEIIKKRLFSQSSG